MYVHIYLYTYTFTRVYIHTYKYTYNTLYGKLILSIAYIHICIQHTSWHAVSLKQVLQEGIQNSESQSVLSKQTHFFFEVLMKLYIYVYTDYDVHTFISSPDASSQRHDTRRNGFLNTCSTNCRKSAP